MLTMASNKNLISEEQKNLVRARFRKGVHLADYVPTFMACERIIRNDGTYFGTALSRRRAEWHGEQSSSDMALRSVVEQNTAKRGDLLHLKDGSNDKNSFVPWRAIFTDWSLKQKHKDEWQSSISSHKTKDAMIKLDTDEERNFLSQQNKQNEESKRECIGNQDFVTFVHEFAPTGALMEARFRIVDSSQNIFEPANEYRLIESENDIREWWRTHEPFSSHEQFFPRNLRMKKLPEALLERGWETKMQRKYRDVRG